MISEETIILDACTVINMLHIDQNDFLWGKIQKLNLKLPEEVLTEIKQNIHKKYSYLETHKIAYSKDEIENLDNILPFFNKFKTTNADIVKDIQTLDYIKKPLNYTKNNGELYCTALGLITSRENNKKVIFYTDDFIAKDDFKEYFDFQQIGTINDSIDLLIFLYWLSDDFSLINLKKYLEDLKSEYYTEIRLFKQEIINIERNLSAQERRKNELTSLLRQLRQSVDEFKFDITSEIISTIKSKRSSKMKLISKDLKKYDRIFTFSTENSISKKIKETLKKLESDEIFTLV